MLVRQGGVSLSDSEKTILAPKSDKELEQIEKTGRYIVRRGDSRAAILIDRGISPLSKLDRLRSLVKAIGNLGSTRTAASLTGPERNQIESALQEYNTDHQQLSGSEVFGLAVDFRVTVQMGGRSVTLGVPASQERDAGSRMDAYKSHPVQDIKTPRDARKLPEYKQPSVEFIWPPTVSGPVDRAELTASAAKALQEIVLETSEVAREELAKAVKQWADQYGNDLRDAFREGDELAKSDSPYVQSMKDMFVRSYQAYGFSSAEDAANAWIGAKVVDSSLGMYLRFGYSEGNSTSIRNLQIGSMRL